MIGKLLKGIGLFCFSSLIGVLLLLSSLFALTQTDVGKRWLQKRIIEEAAKHGILLTMDPIKGPLPFRWKIGNIRLQLPHETTITIAKCKGQIGFLALFRKELYLKSLKCFHTIISHPSTLPSPPFSLQGRGRWKRARPALSWQAEAFLDEFPTTHMKMVTSLVNRELTGSVSLQTMNTEVLSPYLILPKHGKGTLAAQFSGSLEYLRVHTISLTSPLLALQGEVEIAQLKTLAKGSIQVEATYPLPLHGSVSLDQGYLRAETDIEEFTYGAQTFSGGHLLIDATQEEASWIGKIQLHLESEHLPLDLSANVAFHPRSTLSITDLHCEAPQTKVGGKLIFRFPDYALDGCLFGQTTDLSLFRHLLPPYRLKGQCGGEITVTSSPVQKVDLHLLLENVQFDEMQSKRLDLKVEAENLFSLPQGKASIDVEEGSFRNLEISGGSFSIHSEKGALPFQIDCKGDWNSPLAVHAKGTLYPFGTEKKLQVDTFDGTVVHRAFHLDHPVDLLYTQNSWDISSVHLNYTNGWLKGSWHSSKGTADISLLSEHFPLELFTQLNPAAGLAGSAAIECTIKMANHKPKGHLNVLLEQVRLFQYGKRSPLMAKGSFSAHLNPKRLQLHGHLLSSGHQFFTASASLPFNSRTRSFVQNRPFSAQLFVDGRVEEIFDFLSLGSQEIKGHMMGQLFFSNTVEKPHLKGGFTLVDGAYENFAIGASLKDIRLEIEGENDRLKLVSATGVGPKKGAISASGVLHILPKQDFPFQFTASAHNITGIDFDMVSAQASGPIHFDGTMKELLIHGNLSISAAQVKIPDTLPIDIPDYPAQMIHPPPHLKIPPPLKIRYPVRYDFTLDAGDHVMVNGRGLSSEWKGEGHIKGEGADFTGEGTLSLVRGEFNFSGKRFSLTKGEIDVSQNGAFIDLRGNLQLSDVTIIAHLGGSLTSPTLTFQSNPSLSTGEILARLIFDKDMSEITPFQAIQLAQMLVTLSGEGGPNVLEKIRNSLGVDRFNIVSGGATGDEISLQIGKYLTQGVMITLSQSAHSSQVIVEVELKGGFIFQAETQEEEEGKFSLKWNLNY